MRTAFCAAIVTVLVSLSGCVDGTGGNMAPRASPSETVHSTGSAATLSEEDGVHRYGSIMATVYGDEGFIEGATVRIAGIDLRAQTNAEGRVGFRDVKVGNQTVIADYDGRSATVTVVVEENQTHDVLLELSAPVAEETQNSPEAEEQIVYGPPWGAPDSQHTIRPGVRILGCTSNFLYHEPSTGDYFIGLAAHCHDSVNPLQDQTCAQMATATYDPVGTKVELPGADYWGILHYVSKTVMQNNGESDDNACKANDFSLVRIDPRDHDKMHPEALWWGGPTKGPARPEAGTQVYSYGYGIADEDSEEDHAKTGTLKGYDRGGWVAVVEGLGQSPGDSGSYLISHDGSVLAELGGGRVMIDRVLSYANDHLETEIEVVLVEPHRLFTTSGAGTNMP